MAKAKKKQPTKMLRTSERSTFRRCRQKWQWSYGIGAEAAHHGGALTFGSMVHAALAEYYVPGKKRGPAPASTFRSLYEASGDTFSQWDEEGNKVPADVLGLAMLDGYVDQYGKDSNIEIIAPEMTFSIDLHDADGKFLLTYVGSMDAVGRFRDTKRIFVFEHKTAKSVETVRIPSGYGEQGMSYSWAANQYLKELGILKPKDSISTVLYNMLRKGVPDVRPVDANGIHLNKPLKGALVAACQTHDLDAKGTIDVLTDRLALVGVDVDQLGEPSKSQPPPLFERQSLPVTPKQLEIFEQRLITESSEIVAAKLGQLPIYKNPTKDCSWDCQFRDVCEVHEMGGDWKDMMNLDFIRWDPYADHRKDSEEQ